MADSYDIAIIGAGPVGLVLSTLLSRWGYSVFHVDNRPTVTPTGRADGIQPRSLELLKNMGLKNAIMRYKPALVYEVAFWEASSQAGHNDDIVRTGTHASCPEFIDTKYPFTTLLHQGLIERVFVDDMAKHGTEVVRPWEIVDFAVDQPEGTHPVAVTVRKVVEGDTTTEGGERRTVRAKYLFGGEGGRSFVRQKLAIPLQYKDPTEYVWAVMDGVVKTDFPDIKMKCTIRSSHGSIMVIPREDNMVRLYIQLLAEPVENTEKTTKDNYNPHSKLRNTPAKDVQAAAKRVMAPYSIEWERVEWFSVYPIGQGIATRYAGHDERVFVGGDATHTHSPKAGQGMNTAFMDAQNLAWKIHYVESGVADRSILKTYETERKLVAERLLDFDSRYAKLFSGGGKQSAEVSKATKESAEKKGDEFIETFKQACEFTSGYGVSYPANVFNVTDSPLSVSNLKLVPGKMLKPGRVTRVVDANVVQLEQEIPANGAWRIYLFAGQPKLTFSALNALSKHLLSPNSFYSRFSNTSAPSKSNMKSNVHTPDSPFFSVATVFAAHRPDVEISDCPEIVQRYRDLVYADDRKDYVWSEGKAAAVHSKYGLDEEKGGVVVVRPDGYVGAAFRLEQHTGVELEKYFARFFRESAVSSKTAMGKL